MRITSLEGKLAAVIALTAMVGAVVGALAARWLGPLAAIGASALLLLPLALAAARAIADPLARLLRALEGAVASYRDGDFSISLRVTRRDELGELTRLHNELGVALREQRQHLAQRELLLDTVMQNTPVSLLLIDSGGRVVYTNVAARRLLGDGASLLGRDFAALLEDRPAELRRVLAAGEDALMQVELEGLEETFHVSQRGFRLQGRPHRLYLLRRMTRELSRQEVVIWKKVIRVISHELNNALAPISSMAHSGEEWLRRGDSERLTQVFATIGDRVRHLDRFIAGYAAFAKMPAPRIDTVEWPRFIDALRLEETFQLVSPPPSAPGSFDPGQIQQAVINLIRNAREAGSPADSIELEIEQKVGECRIEVLDRGSGMGDAVLANAALPFYSTKRGGTGLGLALVREIVEAHGGSLRLVRRHDGGMRVALILR